jgi:uncharacterized membrane protein (DUF373 family)
MATRMATRLLTAYEWFERTVYAVLLVLLMIVVGWSTISLAVTIGGFYAARLGGAPQADPQVIHAMMSRFELLHDVFGGFLMILIGIELMRTIVVYLAQHELHVEVVFTVAMIAIARHAIDLNLTEISPLTLVGMGVLILSFAAGRHFYRMSAAATGENQAPEV